MPTRPTVAVAAPAYRGRVLGLGLGGEVAGEREEEVGRRGCRMGGARRRGAAPGSEAAEDDQQRCDRGREGAGLRGANDPVEGVGLQGRHAGGDPDELRRATPSPPAAPRPARPAVHPAAAVRSAPLCLARVRCRLGRAPRAACGLLSSRPFAPVGRLRLHTCCAGHASWSKPVGSG